MSDRPSEIPAAPPGWPTAKPADLRRAHNDGGLRARLARAMWRRDYQPGPEAELGGYVYDLADRIATKAIPAVQAETLRETADAWEALADEPGEPSPVAVWLRRRADEFDPSGGHADEDEPSPPVAHLRDRIADVLNAHAIRPREAADAVLPVVEATATAYRDEAREQRQRAEQAKRDLAHARSAGASYRRQRDEIAERAADELEARFQAMREEGSADMRTAISHVHDVLRSNS